MSCASKCTQISLHHRTKAAESDYPSDLTRQLLVRKAGEIAHARHESYSKTRRPLFKIASLNLLV